MARKGKRLLSQAAGAGAARGFFLGGVLRPAIKHYVHPEVVGLENLINVSPPLILAANHSSHMDTPLILNSLPKELRRKTLVAAASDYFFSSRSRGWFFSVAIGAVPMDRRTASKQTMDSVDRLLADKWCLIIYPEGSRTLDGRLYRGKTGIARLALAARAPIVPVGITGTYDAMPSGRAWPVPGHVQVRFGKPLTFDRYLLGVADQLVLRAITDQVMYEIMMLSGQTYIDEYVTSAKRRRQRSDSQAGQEANGQAAPGEAEVTPGDMSDQDTSLCTGPPPRPGCAPCWSNPGLRVERLDVLGELLGQHGTADAQLGGQVPVFLGEVAGQDPELADRLRAGNCLVGVVDRVLDGRDQVRVLPEVGDGRVGR